MSEKTPIEWTDSTVNPTAGCDGCELWTGKIHSCYAGNIYPRLGYGTPFEQAVHLEPGRMAKAARWSDLTGQPRPEIKSGKQRIPAKPWLDGLPRLIFVSDMSDALSQSVSFDYLKTEIIDTVLSDRGKRHQWIWPTKQPKRMAEFSAFLKKQGIEWPRHLWVGTSITTQKATSRINHLLKVGGKDTLRFVSVEPQLEAIDITKWLSKLDWVIQGGESNQRGFKARPFDMAWADQMTADCKKSGIPIFVKQMGTEVRLNGKPKTLKNKKGGDWDEWAKSRRVRQFPPMPEVTEDQPKATKRIATMAKKKSSKKPSQAEETLTTKLGKLATHTSRVGRQIQNGLFIYGRSGTSKTFTVTKTLEQLGVKVSYNNGHVNHEPLFDLFCDNPSGIVILDDVSHILSDKKILNMLIAALGSQEKSPDKIDVRKVTYRSSIRKKLGKPEEVEFTGGIILISNIAIGSHSLHQPLLGRTFPHEHDLSNEEMRVLYYIIAKNGYTLKRPRKTFKLTPKQCKEVADCVLEKCEEIGLRPNVRHLVELAYKVRIDDESQFSWKTLLLDGLEEAKKLEAAIRVEIIAEGSGIQELIDCIQDATSKEDARLTWMEMTGASRPTFFRKLKQMSAGTKNVYDKLDSSHSSSAKAELKKQRMLFSEWMEDMVDIWEDAGTTITKALVIDASVDTEEELLSKLREQPALQEWFDNLPKK